MIYSDTFTDCNADIIPNQRSTVICDNTCNNCNVLCLNIKQCQTMILYSNALNTNIQCSNTMACQSARIYIGDTGIYAHDGFNRSNFNSNKNSVNIMCQGYRGCLKMNIVVNGYIANGGAIVVSGTDSDTFKGSTLDIDIQTNNGVNFNLECGSVNNNCQNVEYRCQNGNCRCNNCDDVTFSNFQNGNVASTSIATTKTVHETTTSGNDIPTQTPTVNNEFESIASIPYPSTLALSPTKSAALIQKR